MSASPTLLKVHHLQVSDFLMCLICYQLSIYSHLQSCDDRSTLTCAKLINRDPHSNTSAVYTDRRGQTGCGLYEPTFMPVRLPVCLSWPSWSVRLSKHGKTWFENDRNDGGEKDRQKEAAVTLGGSRNALCDRVTELRPHGCLPREDQVNSQDRRASEGRHSRFNYML